MKMSFIFLSVLLLACLSCGKADQTRNKGIETNGHETGNGTDNKPFTGAWVLGENSEISYCIVIAPDFGVDRATIRKEVDAAFRAWQEYVVTKKVNEEIAVLGKERAKLFLLPTKARALAKCNGSENVIFHFGSENNQIAKLKKKYVNPTAFAEITSLNTKSGSGQGVIWLVKEGGLKDGKAGYPQWKLPNRLLGILMHEIGHVYGVNHVDETIMQEDMFGLLLNANHTTVDQTAIEYLMSHIDHDKELYLSTDDKDQVYEGTITSDYYSLPGEARPAAEKTFEIFTGKKAKGEMVSKFTNGNLILQDEEMSFTFNFTALSTHYTGQQGVFSVFRSWDLESGSGLSGIGFSLNHLEKVMMGEMVAMDGTKYSIIVEKNQGPPLKLMYFKDGKAHSLLIMDHLYH